MSEVVRVNNSDSGWKHIICGIYVVLYVPLDLGFPCGIIFLLMHPVFYEFCGLVTATVATIVIATEFGSLIYYNRKLSKICLEKQYRIATAFAFLKICIFVFVLLRALLEAQCSEKFVDILEENFKCCRAFDVKDVFRCHECCNTTIPKTCLGIAVYCWKELNDRFAMVVIIRIVYGFFASMIFLCIWSKIGTDAAAVNTMTEGDSNTQQNADEMTSILTGTPEKTPRTEMMEEIRPSRDTSVNISKYRKSDGRKQKKARRQKSKTV